jgi:hypothetical protein
MRFGFCQVLGRSVLLGCGWSVERTVSQCWGGRPVGHEELLRLREGLSALAKLWRLSGRKRRAALKKRLTKTEIARSAYLLLTQPARPRSVFLVTH